MLLRCLELRNPITRFMTRLQQQASQGYNDEYNLLNDEISSEEWEGVQQLVDFLQAPVEMTKRLEGNNSASGFGSLWQTLTSFYYVVATALYPALRLAWFQTYWKQYADWVKRAKDSTMKVFKLYMAAEVDDDDTALPLPRRKVPGGNADLYSQTMAVDLMFLTGSKSHKRQKRAS
ncbi:hypothetical protein AA0118_g9680 [Alternaria tenuissima]|nr:hypothetical protein AA0118_g9680 [Alternaria tenuissima]